MATQTPSNTPVPRGDFTGFRKYLREDVTSGFLVFLIALPLCLGISLASGFPPIAGIFTAIVGAFIAPMISNSELTIKGPAAGLIVIAAGCISDFGGDGMAGGWTTADFDAYRAALAVGFAAAILQIAFGLFRAGILGEFFPSAAVHGMLAAIGVIIIIKQIPFALGVSAGGEPLEMLREIPHYVLEANPAIATIGLVSVLIMFVWPMLSTRLGPLRSLPAPMIVLAVAVPLGMAFDLLHEHSYTLQGHKYQLGEQYLVKMPGRAFGMFDDVTFPDFAALAEPKAWKWVFMFFVIGSLESLLSARAIDLLDPSKRKSSMDRDIVAVGVGNLAAACVGGLPMISEIVRSKSNIDNGARTRFANMWHGVFLLLCVALIPTILHRIPLAALAAMLLYTGYRLAHPTEFVNVWRVGREQLAIFVTTMVVVLATDLLIGVAAGIILKMLIHVANGVPLKALFKPYIEVQEVDSRTSMIVARESAVFSNWIPFRRQIEEIGLVQKRNLIIDLTDARLVDHSVMEKLDEMERDFEEEGLEFEIRGLDALQPYSNSAHSARKRAFIKAHRITITADANLEDRLAHELLRCGAISTITLQCDGLRRNGELNGSIAPHKQPQVRMEILTSIEASHEIIVMLRREVAPEAFATACLEPVDLVPLGATLMSGSFAPPLQAETPTFVGN